MSESSQTGTLSMEIEEGGVVNLTGLCRLCASRCSPGDTEDQSLHLKEDSDLVSKLQLLFNIKITEDDPRLPRQVCSECCSTVKKWETLQKTVKLSQSFYLRQLELHPLPQETCFIPKQEMDGGDNSSLPEFHSSDEEEEETEEHQDFECSTCHEHFTNISYLYKHQDQHKTSTKQKNDTTEKMVSSSIHSMEAENIEVTPIITMSENSDQPCSTRLRKLLPKPKYSFPILPSAITVTKNPSSKSTQRSERTLLKSPAPPKRKSAVSKKPSFAPDLAAKDFPCGKCDLRFDEFVDFAKHIQIHNSSRELPCGICGCNFKKLPYLLKHVMDHKQNPENVQTFPCKLCNTVYNSKKNLGSHLAYRHKARPKRKLAPKKIDSDSEPKLPIPAIGANDFVCGTCRLVYNGIAAFAMHFSEKHPVFYELACGVCDAKFKKLPNLLKHEQLHKFHPNPTIKCQYCDRVFNDQSNFNLHLQIEHSDKSPMPSTSTNCDPASTLATYSCGSCNESFPQIIDFANHFPTSHQMFSQLPCGVCGVKFQEVHSLILHEQEHRASQQYQCNDCPMFFESVTDLNEHYKHLHNTTAPEISSTQSPKKRTITPRKQTIINPEITADGKYKCPHCDLDFENINQYSKHCLTHEPNKCPCCQEVFGNEKLLQKHLRNKHLRTKPKEPEDKKFPCPICGRFFKTKQNVSIHLELHSNERNYVCDICAKSFRNLSNMYKHQQIHFDMPKFTCDFCKREIKHKSAIRKHIMLHIQYLPFKCKICSKAFNCLNLLKTHKRKVHSNMTFNCLQCGKPFKDTRNWRRHMRLICQVPMDQIPYIRDRQFIKHSYLSPN